MLHFYGLTKPANVTLDGKSIQQVQGKLPRTAAGWSVNETTGELSVFIPKSVGGAFTVEFSTRGG